MNKGNRLLVFSIWEETQRRREGANTAVKTGVILQPGDQRWPTLPVPITAVILLPLSLSTEANIGSSLGGRIHPLIEHQHIKGVSENLHPVRSFAKTARHHFSSCKSLYVYWTPFCVGLDYGPWHPKGNCHYNGTTARQGHAHMETLSGAIITPGPLYGFIFSPSSFKDEVKERPCLSCFERRSVAESIN